MYPSNKPSLTGVIGNPFLTMEKEYCIDFHNRAIGIIQVDKSQTKVSHALKIYLRTLQR